MSPLVVSEFRPPSFTQRVDIFGARVVQHFFRPVSLFAVVCISDRDGITTTQCVFVEINIFVRNAFAKLFFSRVTNC